MNVNEANFHCPSHRRCILYVGFISSAKIAASVTHFILSLARSIVMRKKMTSIILQKKNNIDREREKKAKEFHGNNHKS